MDEWHETLDIDQDRLEPIVSTGTFINQSSKKAACVGIGIGVALEVWCIGDAGSQAPSLLTLTHCWGSAVAHCWGLVAREP